MIAPPSPSPPSEPKRRERRKRVGFTKLRLDGSEAEARRSAALVLEVLAGARTPLEAAKAMGVSPPRYYLLEERGILGLVDALKPRARGPGRRPERELEKLRREVKRLERECARGQSLLRQAQRAMGLSSPESEKPPEAGKRKPRRSRLARALRAAEALREEKDGRVLVLERASGDDGKVGEPEGRKEGSPD